MIHGSNKTLASGSKNPHISYIRFYYNLLAHANLQLYYLFKKTHQQITTLQNPEKLFLRPKKNPSSDSGRRFGILEALAKRSMSMETNGSGKSQLGLLDPKKNKNGRENPQKTVVWTDGFKDGGKFTQIDGKVCVFNRGK